MCRVGIRNIGPVIVIARFMDLRNRGQAFILHERPKHNNQSLNTSRTFVQSNIANTCMG